MNIYLKTFIGVTFFVGFIAATFLWFEAEKEVRILCSMFQEGEQSKTVTRILNTGNFLEYRQTEIKGNKTILVDSPYTLGTSRCVVKLSSDKDVLSSQYSQSFKLDKVAAWGGAAGLSGLVIFQLLLAAGFPLGKWAWGGKHKKLPAGLRFASALSVPILLFGIIVLLEKAQLIHVFGKPQLVDYSIWLFAALFGLSILGNLNSESEAERKMGTPIALFLCYVYIIMGMAG